MLLRIRKQSPTKLNKKENRFMNLKKLLMGLVLTVTLAMLSVAFTGCNLFGGSGGLEDGRYVISEVLVNDLAVSQTHAAWIGGSAIEFDIDGSQFSLINALTGVSLISGDYRIRSGYLEQRAPEFNNGRWTRENGSSDSSFVSTRVESGNIVMRHGALSDVGLLLWGTVTMVYSHIDSSLTPQPPNHQPPSGNAPTAQQLHGRWDLTQNNTEGSITSPDDGLWTANYFIEFNAAGTFSERNFWDWTTRTGTWSLNGNNLALTQNQSTSPRSRTVTISSDGNTLIIQYADPIFDSIIDTYTRGSSQNNGGSQSGQQGILNNEFLHGPFIMDMAYRTWHLTDLTVNGIRQSGAVGTIWFSELLPADSRSKMFDTTDTVRNYIPNSNFYWLLSGSTITLSSGSEFFGTPQTVLAQRSGNNLILTAGNAVMTFAHSELI